MFKKSIILAILLIAMLGGGCYQETTTEPTPTPTPPADDGSGSGSGESGTAEGETVNIHFTINYQDDWRIVVQIENHRDKIESVEWLLKSGDTRIISSSLTEPTFDVKDEPGRCGVFTVRLVVVQLKEGYVIGSQTDEQDLNVGDLNPDGCEEPEARFAAQVTCETRDVDFDNLSTGPASTTWLWEFGDGSTSRSKSPSHRYDSDGEFRVILTAKSDGGFGEASEELRIVGPAGASFTRSCPGLTCAFNSDGATGQILSVGWDFGDNTFSSSRNPTKTYDAAGTFQVTAAFTTECNTVRATESVTVAP